MRAKSTAKSSAARGLGSTSATAAVSAARRRPTAISARWARKYERDAFTRSIIAERESPTQLLQQAELLPEVG